ncbi:Glu/Leu/Phe/Val dehydrogenase family protein [Paenibacillus daejeonensis]|uniref:Glu/Leu/Phe/Val dehydrogenase family protein n=1 Tax=Paenibacillus daejeonensis TaxID=135193 RepID=UPI00035C9FCC|nr:Glu/Leu/Phe/Val dehydrogenase dimerization domain-containing protein [Paenibacillus daejeonensis]
MSGWDTWAKDPMEQLVWMHERQSGLRAIIAVHHTGKGPALGGCRVRHYASDGEALDDALQLARSMTYKCALAGIPYGGGKAVVLAPPGFMGAARQDAFRALGRQIARMQGLYITGLDLGSLPADMDEIRQETAYVTDTTGSLGATGDLTADMTAYGVYLAIRTAAQRQLGSDQLTGRTVAVQGLGKVGSFLCAYLAQAGAHLIVSDLDPALVARARQRWGAHAVPADQIHRTACDIFAPCAVGGILNSRTLPELRCRIVAGAANNQLAEEAIADQLQARGILYAPDYAINSGGIIVTAAELDGRDAASARHQTESVPTTLTAVLDHADQTGITPAAAAAVLAKRLIG